MSRYTPLHSIPSLAGPADARPTALTIIHDSNLVGKLTHKTFLVTGVSSGIGIETLRALHATGARVFGTVRDMAKGTAVVDKILSERHPGGGEIELVRMDLDVLASVRAGAEEVLNRSGGKLNGLICNAGIMATPYATTIDGFETQFATNHLAHFLLFQLLKPSLLASATPTFPSRVVSVTSSAHFMAPLNTGDYNFERTTYAPWVAYGAAKTANIWFASALERRYASRNLHAMSVHPGGIQEGSNLAAHLSKEDIDALQLTSESLRTFKSAEQGAATQVWAAVGGMGVGDGAGGLGPLGYGVGEDWWKKIGGKYLASLQVMGSREEEGRKEGMFDHANEGYAEWAYDVEGEERLWVDSLRMVGLGDEGEE